MQTYNPKQIEVVNAPEDYVSVEAPPGSGKTYVLIGAIQQYAKEHPKAHIVAITFTRKAAGELAERIAVDNVEVSTIHSWAYRRLAILGEEYCFPVQILEEDRVKDILKQLCVRSRQYYINQFQLYSYVMGNYNIDIDDKIKRTYEAIRYKYIKYKREHQLYDFTDLPLYLLDKLKEYHRCIDDIDAFFVDEFQDIDTTEQELFERVMASKKLYIGDPRQSIYAFRGSLDDAMQTLSGFAHYSLVENYRSYQEIIDYATSVRNLWEELQDEDVDMHSLILHNQENYQLSYIECERGEGGKVYTMPDIGECIDVVNWKPANQLSILKSIMEDPTTQILCRSNKQVKKLISLGFDNVSTVHQAKGLEYDKVIVVDFEPTNNEEMNIGYVAMTRAKNELCIVNFEVLLYHICRGVIKKRQKALF